MCGAFWDCIVCAFLCYFDITVSLGDFASAEATGALPLDPATFEKVDETFDFLVGETFAFSFAN